MRAVKNFIISKEYKPGHYGPTRVLQFRDKTGKHKVDLGAGGDDHVHIYREGTDTYVVTINFGLSYCGLEVFRGGEKVGDIFLQEDWNVRECLGPKGVDLAPYNIAKTLSAYCSQ